MKTNTNDVQNRAIRHYEGPFMCLAGPGAGKTYVITNRVKNLIEEYGTEPEKILVVTFSKAAAIEMKGRFEELMEGQRARVRFGTFHSVFFQILRAAYHYEAKDIVTQSLKYRFLEETLDDIEYEIEDRKEFLENIEEEISKVKGEGIDVDCYYSANCPEQVFRDMFQGYQNRLHSHRALDFDDMVVYTYELLRARKDILAMWQRHFTFILIDEFQDINRLQYETIRMLAEPENNLFIVGDDDQSIYGFRGSRPDIMLSFPRQYPRAEQVTLDVNYRSSSQILTAAGKLIAHNKKRYEKHITSHAGKFEGVHISRCRDLSSESERIVKQIKSYHEAGIPYEEMAILFRTNMQMRTPAGKLMEHGIPFTMKESINNIFHTWLAKDILCYVELGMGDRSRDKILKICNRPVRYLSRAAFHEPQVDFRDIKSYYAAKNQFWMLERIDDFQNELHVIGTMSPYSAINYIRKGIGYDEWLTEYAKERNVSVDDWLEVLEEVQETARDCKSLTEWLAFVENYGETLEQMQKEQQEKQEKTGVQLMTMHGAKGLEFTAVFVPTINEDVCPYRKAVQSGDIEEERRMLYVAMTRAKKYLHLSFVRQRFNKNAEPSRFLFEISPELEQQEVRR